jgi:hypothetical protein
VEHSKTRQLAVELSHLRPMEDTYGGLLTRTRCAAIPQSPNRSERSCTEAHLRGLRGKVSSAVHLRRRSGVTIGGNSTLGAAVLNALNCVGFRNMTLHWLHAKNCVS